MTAEEFVEGYCRRSGITKDYYREWFVSMSCNCGCDECEGWATIRNTPEAIGHQKQFYGGRDE